MEFVHSAGAIIYNPKLKKYLLLKYGAGHWDFVKGHIEKGESEEETVLRECEEETGIKNLKLLPGFKKDIVYFYKSGDELVKKKVTFFIGLTEEEKVTLSFEHKDYVWLPYEEAIKKATFKEGKELIKWAQKALQSISKV